MIPRKNTHNHLPSAHRQKLPFGMHEQQLIAGKNIMDRIPRAKANFEKLERKNTPLAMLVLSKVHKEYNRTKHFEAKDLEKRDRYHKIAAQDVTKLIGRGFVADRVMRETRMQFNPGVVDAVINRKVLRVSDAKNLAKKIIELERLNQTRAKETKSRLSSLLTAPLSHAEEMQGMTHYKRALGFIERQIEFAKQNHK